MSTETRRSVPLARDPLRVSPGRLSHYILAHALGCVSSSSRKTHQSPSKASSLLDRAPTNGPQRGGGGERGRPNGARACNGRGCSGIFPVGRLGMGPLSGRGAVSVRWCSASSSPGAEGRRLRATAVRRSPRRRAASSLRWLVAVGSCCLSGRGGLAWSGLVGRGRLARKCGRALGLFVRATNSVAPDLSYPRLLWVSSRRTAPSPVSYRASGVRAPLWGV